MDAPPPSADPTVLDSGSQIMKDPEIASTLAAYPARW